ncbi:MAG: hypothetical protein HOV94_24040 [Saccharothrix sp.]|nr:hypothetical protein [Saccharothrix sp.]
MIGHIGQLTCEYVTADEQAAAELDRLAATSLADELEAALDAVLDADETVYVVGEVVADCRVDLHAPDPAGQWARSLAEAVDAVIAGAGSGVVSFPDEAAYLARYLAESLRGRAAGSWCFRPLTRFHDARPAEVLLALAREGRAAGVLAALQRDGLLPEILSSMTAAELAVLARCEPGVDPASDPLVAAAVRVADCCGLWTNGPMPVAVAARWLRPSRADWSDPVSLTGTVVDLLRQLADAGVIARDGEPPPPRLRTELDWLDLPRLTWWLTERESPEPGLVDGRTHWADLVRALVTSGTQPARPLASSTARETPEQEVRRVVLRLVARGPGSAALRQQLAAVGPGPRAAVLLRAAVAADQPQWMADHAMESVVADAVAGVVAAWERHVASAGIDEVVHVLTGPAAVPGPTPMTSPVAGVLLLLRAVVDLRLPAVLHRAGCGDALPATLLAVAIRLTGAVPEDPAALLFAGLPASGSASAMDVWRQASARQCQAVRTELEHAVAAHGVELADVPAFDGALGHPVADGTLDLVAFAVLRAWSRWLGRFATARVEYLVAHFLRRWGAMEVTEDEVAVELAEAPLDVVLELAGYLSPVTTVPWLGGRTATFRLGSR